MTELLTIHCAVDPNDTLDVEVSDNLVHVTIYEIDRARLALNRQSAQELYDLLGEFLADDQR